MKRVWVGYLEIAYISALVFSGILLWLPRLNGPLDFRYDAGVYYILGTSLAEGKGYRLLNEPGAIQAIQYPPLLPLFAAVHQLLAGSSDPTIVGHMLRISFFGIFLVFIVAAYLLSRHFLPPGLAFLAALGTLFHVQTTWMSDLFFAELPFALASVAFLLVARRAKEKSFEWLAGAIAVSCFLLRTPGIAVLGAWVGEALVKRRFRQMGIRAGVALVPILAWQAYIAGVKRGPEYAQPAYQYQRAGYQFYNVGYLDNLAYVDPFTPELGKESIPRLVGRIARNLMSMPRSLGAAVSGRPEWATRWFGRINTRFGTRWIPVFVADLLPFLALGTLVLFGLILLSLRGEWLVAGYVVGSGLLISLTPWPGQFERYLWPLTPVLFIALFATLALIKNRFSTAAKGRLRIPVAATVTVVVLGVFSTELVALRNVYRLADKASYSDGTGKRQQYSRLFYTPEWKHHDEALDWLDQHAGPNEIVATSTPHWVYIKTGLPSVMPPFEPNVVEAQRLMDSVPVSYLIVDSLNFVDVSRRYAAPTVDEYPGRWELVYSSARGGSRIYRRTNQDKGLDHRKMSQVE
jgi:hypothetical protein